MKKQTLILYILTGIVLAAALLFVFVGFPGTQPDTAAVILPETGPDDKEKEEDRVPDIIEVSPDTVQTVIRSMSRVDSYSRSICAESFWSGGSTVRNIDVWVRGGDSKMEISRPDSGEVMHVLLKDGNRQIWYSGKNGSFESPASARDSDSYQALLSYERILDLAKEDISEASYEDFMGEMCICVRYTSGELGYENCCYVSLASGLVIGEESWENGTLVIRVTSTMPDYSEPAGSVFEGP